MTVERPLPYSAAKIMENGYDNPVPIENTRTSCTNNVRSSAAADQGITCTTHFADKTHLNESLPPPPLPPPPVPPYTSSIENGQATATVENLRSGVYVIPVVCNGNGNGNGNHSKSNICANLNTNSQQNNKNNTSFSCCGGESNEKQKLGYINNKQPQPKMNNLSEKAYIDYDPHQHNVQQKNPTSYWDTIFHLLKASLGTGILAMPNAFQNAGYAVGLIGTLIIGFLCTYNIHILVSSEYELCKRRKVPSMTYPETVQVAFEEGPLKFRRFARFGHFLTNMFLVIYQIGTSSIYALFIASNLQDVYDSYYHEDTNVRTMLLYLLAPSILICWVRNLKLLVPFSTIANAATILSFGLIFGYVFNEVPSFTDREPVGTMQGIPLFFGTVLFAMEAIGMVMPLKNQMKKPKKFGSLFGVLNASMLPITVLYAFIGFFGYLKYGSKTTGSITLNLPSDEFLAKLVKLLYSGSIFITYALSNYVTFDIIWTNSIKSKITSSSKCVRIFWEYIVRTTIVFVTLFLAGAVPNLEIFISFVGAFCLSSIGVAYPAIVQILTHWYHHDDAFQFSIMIFKNIIIILIAILAFTIGVSSSVMKFIHEMM